MRFFASQRAKREIERQVRNLITRVPYSGEPEKGVRGVFGETATCAVAGTGFWGWGAALDEDPGPSFPNRPRVLNSSHPPVRSLRRLCLVGARLYAPSIVHQPDRTSHVIPFYLAASRMEGIAPAGRSPWWTTDGRTATRRKASSCSTSRKTFSTASTPSRTGSTRSEPRGRARREPLRGPARAPPRSSWS